MPKSTLNQTLIKITYFYLEVPVNFSSENLSQCFVVKGVNAQNVHMTDEPITDGTATASWRTQCTNQENIQKFKFGSVFSVLPMAMINPLKKYQILIQALDKNSHLISFP